jgi:hypothetical protein
LGEEGLGKSVRVGVRTTLVQLDFLDLNTMAAADATTDDSLYPIAVLIDELRNEDVQVIS